MLGDEQQIGGFTEQISRPLSVRPAQMEQLGYRLTHLEMRQHKGKRAANLNNP